MLFFDFALQLFFFFFFNMGIRGYLQLGCPPNCHHLEASQALPFLCLFHLLLPVTRSSMPCDRPRGGSNLAKGPHLTCGQLGFVSGDDIVGRDSTWHRT